MQWWENEILREIKPMKLIKEEECAFQMAVTCSICQKFLFHKLAKDHDHIKGVYRDEAHVSWNFNLKQSKKKPVIFYNLMNCDVHHLITKLGKYKIDVIASTLEK